MNLPTSDYKPTYTPITENSRADLRLDMVANEIQITVYSCPISNIDALIEKLQSLKTQVAPAIEQRIQAVTTANVIQMEIVKEFSTLLEVDDEDEAYTVIAPVKYENVQAPAPSMPTPRKGKSIINIIGVTTKGYTRYGKKYPGTINMKHNADIAKQQWIRIYGIESDRTKYDQESGIATHYTPAFDLTFKMGDTCVYDSYNLVYTGKIVGIGAKTVTIEKSGYRRNTVLDIATFIHRNWDYDAKAIFERNSNWSD